MVLCASCGSSEPADSAPVPTSDTPDIVFSVSDVAFDLFCRCGNAEVFADPQEIKVKNNGSIAHSFGLTLVQTSGPQGLLSDRLSLSGGLVSLEAGAETTLSVIRDGECSIQKDAPFEGELRLILDTKTVGTVALHGNARRTTYTASSSALVFDHPGQTATIPVSDSLSVMLQVSVDSSSSLHPAMNDADWDCAVQISGYQIEANGKGNLVVQALGSPAFHGHCGKSGELMLYPTCDDTPLSIPVELAWDQ